MKKYLGILMNWKIRTFYPTGKPIQSLRDWYDPWILFGEMIVITVMAVVLLVIDIGYRFTDREYAFSKREIISDFKERMDIVITSIPFYLDEVRRVDKYNREV